MDANVLFITHVLLSTSVRLTLVLLFMSFFTSSHAAFHNAVSLLVGKTTALRLTLAAFLRKFFGRQQNTQCNRRNKTRDIQNPFQKFTKRPVTNENVHKLQKKINKLGNLNNLYKSTGIPTITGRIWGSSVSIGTRLRNRRCRVRILLPSRDFHLLIMVLPSRSHVTFPSLVFLHLLLKKSQFVVTIGTPVTYTVWAERGLLDVTAYSTE